MIQKFLNKIVELISGSEVGTVAEETSADAHPVVYILVCAGFCILLLLCLWGVYRLSRMLLTTGINTVTARIGKKWNEILIESRVPARISHLVIAILCTHLYPIFFSGEPLLLKTASAVASIYFAVALAASLYALVDAIMIYGSTSKLKDLPIKGFFQAVKLIVTLVIGIWVLSILSDRSPMYFLSGLGALMAVLVLVFRDTLLGFTAGIMISANKLVLNGDWIEIEGKANGVVQEVSLTTVKVRNWDNTISSIPAYSLISDTFKNWRGMTDSGGRRIKRAIKIDVETIHFATQDEIAHWQKIRILRPYLEQKSKEFADVQTEVGTDLHSTRANSRWLTNIGTFRAYCVAYLRANEKDIRQDMTLIVRQLEIDSTGIPLEIYVFTRDTSWVGHENVQSDIFDHLFAIMPEFNLRPFQQPSGKNFEKVITAK